MFQTFQFGQRQILDLSNSKSHFWNFLDCRPSSSSAPWPWAKLKSSIPPSTMLALLPWFPIPTRKFIYIFHQLFVYNHFPLFQSMFPPTSCCLQKLLRKIWSSCFCLQLWRTMWTLRFVRSCHRRGTWMFYSLRQR